MPDTNESDEKALKRLAEVRRALAPTSDVSMLARSMANARDLLGPSIRAQDLLGPNIRSLSSIAQQIERSSVLWRTAPALAELKRAFQIPDYTSTIAASSVVKSIQAQTSATQELMKSIDASSLRWREAMNSIEASSLRMKLPNFAFENLNRSAFVWDSGISEAMRRFSETNLTRVRADLCGRMLEPSRVFSRFAEETLSLIREMPDTRTLRALNASLALVDAQHLANVDALCSFATAVDDDEVISIPRILDSPFIQQTELLELPEIKDEEQVEELVLRLPAARASEQSRNVLTLTTSCNKASSLKGKGDVFKPTTKVMEVFTDLPWLTPQDEKSFGEFIDCLYFVIYEGAGKDKLRFLTAQGGPLEADDCQVVWCIKILRNKWLRHDVDHGKESDIRKSWNDLNFHLQWLGSGGYPHTPEDFRRLHVRLLLEVESFLKKLVGSFI